MSTDLVVCHSAPQDDTPTKWDTNYYKQTQAATAPRGVYRFDADVNLANSTTATGQAFTEFGNSLGRHSPSRPTKSKTCLLTSIILDAWNQAFSAAMLKLSLLGIPDSVSSGFVDCTSLVQ
jgi:manganese peroxidase